MSKLLCPRCEKLLGESHDANGCKRRMSRRFFFGLCAAPLVAKIAAKVPVAPHGELVVSSSLRPLVWKYTYGTNGPVYGVGNLGEWPPKPIPIDIQMVRVPWTMQQAMQEIHEIEAEVADARAHGQDVKFECSWRPASKT